MADEIDLAQARAEEDTDRAIAAVRNSAASIPAGQPGDCDFCGTYFSRLVGGACGACRDRYKLP